MPEVGDMWGIITDHNGGVWITQYAGKGSVSPGGTILPGGTGYLLSFNESNDMFSSINIPGISSFPMRITVDPRNRLWFTEFLGNKIGEYDPSTKRLTEYPVPTNDSGPADLTFDKKGVLWFTEAYSQKVARFDIDTHLFTEYNLSADIPSRIVSSPVGISVDSNGIVWVADHGGNWIVAFDPTTGNEIHYPTHTPPEEVYPISIPNGLLIDKTERIWFSEHGGNSIGYVSSDRRTMVEYAIPTGPISTPLWIALAPSGDVWFAEWSSNKIGVVHGDLPIPMNVQTETPNLTVQTGNTISIAVVADVAQALSGNATWDSAWSSYSPRDVRVDFLPSSLSLGTTGVRNVEARLEVSTRVDPGNYTLSLGVNQGSVRVSSMIDVRVEASTGYGIDRYLPYALLILIVAGLLTILLFFRRRRPNSKLKPL